MPTGATSAGAEQAQVAGLVVDYGDGRMSYALIPFGDATVSGIELLDQSGLAILSVEFGGMGLGICKIEDVGCEVQPCRARLCQSGDPASPFWHFVQAEPGEPWQMAPLGASSTRLGDGMISGWFWTGESPAGLAPTFDALAATLHTDLADVTGGRAEMHLVTVGDGSGAPDRDMHRDIWLSTGLLAAMTVTGVVLVYRARWRR